MPSVRIVFPELFTKSSHRFDNRRTSIAETHTVMRSQSCVTWQERNDRSRNHALSGYQRNSCAGSDGEIPTNTARHGRSSRGPSARGARAARRMMILTACTGGGIP